MVLPAFQSLRKSLGNNRKLFSNAFYLYVFQGLNYLLPLITIPYLIRVLRTDTFGKLAFYGAFMAYFQIIVDYGFNLSATRDASLARSDRDRLSSLFCSVLLIKSALLLLCALFLGALVAAVPRFHQEASLCLWLFIGVAGSILFPTWLFQGMEEMRYITIFNLASKLAVTVLYFLCIKSPANYLWFAYLNSGGTLLAGAVAFVVAVHKFRIRFVLPAPSTHWKVLQNGLQIFISQVSVTMVTNSNIFLLGIFTNNQIVGKYAIADKITRAAISLAGPVGSAIYPRTALLFSESRERAIRFLRKITWTGSALFGSISLFLFIFADMVVLVVTGTRSHEIALLIRIMSLLPLTVFVDNIYGTQIMLNIHLQKQFMRIILCGGFLSVVMLLALVPHFKGIGSAVSFLVSEFAILTLMVITVRKRDIRLYYHPIHKRRLSVRQVVS
jgi:PST family polysaccharide transporter